MSNEIKFKIFGITSQQEINQEKSHNYVFGTL